MGFSLLVAFALPITLFILCRKRLNAARLPALIGALTFTVAVLVLENAAHSLLRPLTSSPAVQGLRPAHGSVRRPHGGAF